MKRIFHFFKLHSRLGLLNPPINSNEINIGVEDAPDEILSDDFLKLFDKSKTETFHFPLPENINENEYEDVLKDYSYQCALSINDCLEEGETAVAIGGDHSITFGTFLALLLRFEKQGKDVKDIGYIQFDSHADMNLKSTSPTGNFHGMYLRAILDKDFDLKKIESLIPLRLPKENVLFIGNLDLDPTGEKDFFVSNNILHISHRDAKEDREKSLLIFKEFVNRFKHLHVSFDIDGLDKSIAPGTGIPAFEGLLLDDVKEMLRVISRHPSISFDLVEVNPKKTGGEETVKIAKEILKYAL